MEGPIETLEDRRLLFAVIGIEEGAKRLGVSPREMCERLHRQGLIEGRLFKHYDTLHTQSQAYVADDIVEALLSREANS